MKSLYFAATAAAFISTSFAATLTVGNGVGTGGQETANGVVDSAGNLLIDSTGSAAFGVFNGSDFTSVGAILSAFTEFGSSETTFSAPGSPAFIETRGAFEASGSSTDNATFQNQPIVAIFGNATTLAASTELAVVQLTATFGDVSDPTAFLPDVRVSLANTNSFLLGNQGPSRQVLGGAFGSGTSQPTFQTTAPVPEPTTSLLLGGSLLALGFRRRRA